MSPSLNMRMLSIAVYLLIGFSSLMSSDGHEHLTPKMQCPEEEAPEDIMQAYAECQKMLDAGALHNLEDHMQGGFFKLRKKRQDEPPKIIPDHERHETGCLIQCAYLKLDLLEEDGLPKKQELFVLLERGILDEGYYAAANSTFERCYQKIITETRQNGPLASGREYCDLALLGFECYTHGMKSYCEGLSK